MLTNALKPIYGADTYRKLQQGNTENSDGRELTPKGQRKAVLGPREVREMADKTKDRFPSHIAERLLHESMPPSSGRDPLGIPRKRTTHDLAGDDLILALSDSRENRRARQVFEWETVRRNIVRNI